MDNFRTILYIITSGNSDKFNNQKEKDNKTMYNVFW